MNTIINPIDGKEYNLYSTRGRELLKLYINNYKSGGMYSPYQQQAPRPTNLGEYVDDCENKKKKYLQIKNIIEDNNSSPSYSYFYSSPSSPSSSYSSSSSTYDIPLDDVPNELRRQ